MKPAAEVRFISTGEVEEALAAMCIEACTRPPAGLRFLLEAARDASPGGPGRTALELCMRNLDEAESTGLPICQDTGIAVVFAERGNRLVISDGSLRDAINRGVERGYREGRLRNSLVSDPLGRIPLPSNSPAVLHLDEVEGDRLKLSLLVKGAGSENVSVVGMMPPLSGEDDVVEFVKGVVNAGAAGACPPVFVGVGLGGNLEMCGVLAKKALMRPIGIPNGNPGLRLLEKRILEAANSTGIGPQGFGGPVTALEARVETAPCHMASLPLAVCLGCHAHRTSVRSL